VTGEGGRGVSSGESPAEQCYVLVLYVVGATGASRRAIAAIREICDSMLSSRHTLEVIDLSQQPELAVREQIVATPTLIRRLPPPIRRLVGDLSDRERVLVGLDLQPGS
jgi:circadian clock protein KaiB